MDKYVRAYAVTDEDMHWYVIPYELRYSFFDEKNYAYSNDDFQRFENMFNKYMTDGDLNNVELYIKL